MNLNLHSPVGAGTVAYKWPLIASGDRDDAKELIETMRLVSRDFPELILPMKNHILVDYDINSYESMTNVCTKYNRAIDSIRQLWKGTSRPDKLNTFPSVDLLKLLLFRSYIHCIDDDRGDYTYLPTTSLPFELVKDMISKTHLTDNDVVVHIGCGTGETVMQVAASVDCKFCYGIEKPEYSNINTQKMETEFKKWLHWFGKTYSDFKVENGDILSQDVKKLIRDARLLFVDTINMPTSQCQQLYSQLLKMPEGSMVVSTHPIDQESINSKDKHHKKAKRYVLLEELRPQNVKSHKQDRKCFLYKIESCPIEKKMSSRLSHEKKTEVTDLPEKGSVDQINRSSGEIFDDLIIETVPIKRYKRSFSQSDRINRRRHSFPRKFDQRRRSGEIVDHELNEDTTMLVENLKRDMEWSASPFICESPETPTAVDSEAAEIKNVNRYPGRRRSSRHKRNSLQIENPHCEYYETKSIRSGIVGDRDDEVNHSNAPLQSPSKNLNNKNGIRESSPTPPELKTLLDGFKNDYQQLIAYMQTPTFKVNVRQQIEAEKIRKEQLLAKLAALEKKILVLQRDGVDLLKLRMSELGMIAGNSAEFLQKAKDIVQYHRDLESQVTHLSSQVTTLELEQHKLNYDFHTKGFPSAKQPPEKSLHVDNLTSRTKDKTEKREQISEHVTMRNEIDNILTRLLSTQPGHSTQGIRSPSNKSQVEPSRCSSLRNNILDSKEIKSLPVSIPLKNVKSTPNVNNTKSTASDMNCSNSTQARPGFSSPHYNNVPTVYREQSPSPVALRLQQLTGHTIGGQSPPRYISGPNIRPSFVNQMEHQPKVDVIPGQNIYAPVTTHSWRPAFVHPQIRGAHSIMPMFNPGFSSFSAYTRIPNDNFRQIPQQPLQAPLPMTSPPKISPPKSSPNKQQHPASHQSNQDPKKNSQTLPTPSDQMPYAVHVKTIIDSVKHGKPVPKGIFPAEADLDSNTKKRRTPRRRSAPKQKELKPDLSTQSISQFHPPMPGFTTAGFSSLPPPTSSPHPPTHPPLHISAFHPSGIHPTLRPSNDGSSSVLKNMLNKNSFAPHLSGGRVTDSPDKNWPWVSISSGFDALVAFASSELNRNREMKRQNPDVLPDKSHDQISMSLPASHHNNSNIAKVAPDTSS